MGSRAEGSFVIRGQGGLVAVVEREDDARLIVAAHGLLDALVAVTLETATWDQVYDAIATATGEIEQAS